MANVFGSLQAMIMLALSVAALGLVAYALVDAIRQRQDAFPASNNQTKMLWLILLGVSVALAITSIGTVGLFNMIAAVVGAIYVTKVRPAIRQITGRGSGGGPYGGW